MDTVTLVVVVLVILLSNLETITTAFGVSISNKWAAVAYMAFSYVEKTIPDNFGSNSADPAYAKMMHKADTFLQKFKEFYVKFNGIMPSDSEINKAQVLASELATGSTPMIDSRG